MTGRGETAATGAPDVVVVGGGHNALVCAAYLGRAGLKVLVVERRPLVGGTLDTVELMPGVRAPGLVNSVGRLATRVARDLRLADHGLRLVSPEARLTSIDGSGRMLTLWADARRTAAELRAISPADAAAYERFDADTRALAAMSARINAVPPPDVERLRLSDLARAFGLWRGYRGLGARRAREYLRVLPMPIGDYVADFFETDQLRAALAWRGVRYTAMAPGDAGSTQVFLADTAGTTDGTAGEMALALGGPGALAESLAAAAQAAGVEIRAGAEVVGLTGAAHRTTGVELAGGERIAARAVVSGVDPKRTLLGLLDPIQLGPTDGWEAGNLRLAGALSAVQLALADLPAFAGLAGGEARERLAGRILIASGTRVLDRAADAVKGACVADELVLEATIPSLLDPGLVDAGGAATQVMNILVHGTPYHRASGDWDAERDSLGDSVIRRLEQVAPGIGGLVVGRRVVTPLDLERDYGLTEGHPLHAEPGLDQWFAWRPMLGMARYRLPPKGLYLCGSGAHPGGGVTGDPGRLCAREVLSDFRRGQVQ